MDVNVQAHQPGFKRNYRPVYGNLTNHRASKRPGAPSTIARPVDASLNPRQLAARGGKRSSIPGFRLSRRLNRAVRRNNVYTRRSDRYKLINGNDVMGMIRFWPIDLVATEAE